MYIFLLIHPVHVINVLSFKETTTNAADIVFVGEEQNGTTESSDEEDDIDKISEIRFIPEDKTSRMFYCCVYILL